MKDVTPIGKLNKRRGEVIIGCFYQVGKNVVYLCGSGPDGVHGYDMHGKSVQAKSDDVKKWTMLDVNEFPNEKDHRLAYVFDLNWDIKRVSQIPLFGDEDWLTLKKLLHSTYGVSFKSHTDKKALAELNNVLKERNDLANGYVVKEKKKEISSSISPDF